MEASLYRLRLEDYLQSWLGHELKRSGGDHMRVSRRLKSAQCLLRHLRDLGLRGLFLGAVGLIAAVATGIRVKVRGCLRVRGVLSGLLRVLFDFYFGVGRLVCGHINDDLGLFVVSRLTI